MIKLNIQDTFNKELPVDPIRSNDRRQVHEACLSFVHPRIPSNPSIIHYSTEMLENIGLSPQDVNDKNFKEIFTGAQLLEGTDPYAMCYGGHQFGHWAGQLGDGRAINLAEVVHQNKRWALQLKGSGATPYSRTADGLAVLRSSIREHLCSEAMHHLGVPTTRSLSLALTGDQVLRDVMYDGHPEYEKGAVVCRVAPSFLRFGNFQLFAARQDSATLKKLTDYTIRNFFPAIKSFDKKGYLEFFKEVANQTLNTIVLWQRVGFVHGVMNTDNLSILGLTIDYGPYGWLEGYDPEWTPNTTDAQGKRYRFGNQPYIGLWNLAQLGGALNMLIDDLPALQEILADYQTEYPKRYLSMMKQKLGLMTSQPSDVDLIQSLEENLKRTETDMTIFFRLLSNLHDPKNKDEKSIDLIHHAFYKPDSISEAITLEWTNWFEDYKKRIELEREVINVKDRIKKMNAVNPKYVFRNYMAQLAIDKADVGDYSLIDELHKLLKRPYDEQPENEKWFQKRPEWARHKVGCSMLSCSS